MSQPHPAVVQAALLLHDLVWVVHDQEPPIQFLFTADMAGRIKRVRDDLQHHLAEQAILDERAEEDGMAQG